LANAFVTGSQALGHGKSASNEQMVRRYREELTSRGEEVPELGLFDGAEQYKKGLYERGGLQRSWLLLIRDQGDFGPPGWNF
jgi:hypothetical protein